MQNPRNQCYQDELIKVPAINPMYNQNNTGPKFELHKILEIDDLLNKNDEIYKNLRMKLQQISLAQRNITNNINTIRPIYYSSRQRENSLHMYDKFLFDSNEEEKTIVFDNYYDSSPIQSERPPNQSFVHQKMVVNGGQDGEQSNMVQIQKRSQVMREYPQISQLKRTNNTIDKNSVVSESILRKKVSSSISSQEYTNPTQSSATNIKDISSPNLRASQSAILDRQKQAFYFLNKSYQPCIDSIVKMNFGELNQRRQEIEQIYGQLKKQEEEIQKAYQDYRNGFMEMNKVDIINNKSKENKYNFNKSSPKKSSPIRNFAKVKKQQFQSNNNSRLSVISKTQELKTHLKSSSSSNFNQKNELTKIPQSNNKIEFSPIKSSMIEYCTQQLQSVEIPQKPKPMTARSHIFVPFNKLYKSSIIQMKNKNILVLARQSKLVSQKTSEMKILDGKKYKFPQNIQTDEQQLIRNVMTKDHNIIAIVGGQTTLKKKLQMAIIAHSFDKIMKIISSKEYNCLTFFLSYQELIEKHDHLSQRINNSIEINEETQMKIVILEAQKTIQDIYNAIKRPHTLTQSSSFIKNSSQSTKEKPKVVRFSKLSLMSGKQCIWACNTLSANQFTCDFLKSLEVKDIIWSINPLIKNYDEVFKTLNESTKYIESRIQS